MVERPRIRVQKIGELIRRGRTAEQVSLHQVAALGFKKLELKADRFRYR